MVGFRFKARDEDDDAQDDTLSKRIVKRHRKHLKIERSRKKQKSMFGFMSKYRFKVGDTHFMSAANNNKLNNLLKVDEQVKLREGHKNGLDGGLKGMAYKMGWLKFLTLPAGAEFEGLAFYINNAYHEQGKKPEPEDAEEDDFGPSEIPDKNSFFFILTPYALTAVSSRRNELQHTVKAITIDTIDDITGKRPKWKGGLEDIGNFDEGFCFSVVAEEVTTWVMCAETADEKEEWM